MAEEIASTKRSNVGKWIGTLLFVAVVGLGVWFWRSQTVHSQNQNSAEKGGGQQQGAGTEGPGGAGGGRGSGGGGRRGAGNAEIPVAVAKARTGDVPVYLDGLGSVNAFYTVTVRSRVDGEMVNMPVREGDFVRKGQLLAQIDPRPFEAQLKQAQGQYARDEALLQNAKLDLSRYQTLLQQDAIPKQQLDTQRATVGQYEGALKQDQAAIDTANLQLTYARITAPISGRIGLRLVDPGNIVRAGDANGLVVITQLQPIAVLFTIPEDALLQIRRKVNSGFKLPVQAFNRDKTQRVADGRLLTFDNQIDPQTGTSRLKAVFENRDNALFPNQFVNVRLLVETLKNKVLVPTVAIQRGQKGTYVFVVKDNSTVDVRNIQVGETEGSDTEIASGLQAGETVVTDGIDRLAPGGKVRVRGPEGTGGPGGGRGGRRGQGGQGGQGGGRNGQGRGNRGDSNDKGGQRGAPPA